MNDDCFTVLPPHDGKLPKMVGWREGEPLMEEVMSEARAFNLALDLLRAVSLMRRFPG